MKSYTNPQPQAVERVNKTKEAPGIKKGLLKKNTHSRNTAIKDK